MEDEAEWAAAAAAAPLFFGGGVSGSDMDDFLWANSLLVAIDCGGGGGDGTSGVESRARFNREFFAIVVS